MEVISTHGCNTLPWKGKAEWMRKKQKGKRRGCTAAELGEVWDRWQRGESSKEIARVLGRGASVYSVLLRHGGIRPPRRCRSLQVLTLAEREGWMRR